MEKNQTNPLKRAGNKTTEVVIGAAVIKIESAVKQMNAAVEEVNKLEAKINDGTLKVTDLEDKIGGLDQDLKNKIAQHKIELQQAYDSNKEQFVTGWLNEKAKVAVAIKEYEELTDKLEEATEKVEERINTEVSKAVGIAKSKHEQEIKIIGLEYQTREANNLAKITNLEVQNKFYESQILHWQVALEEERKAGVERARAASIGTLNVGNTPR